MMRIKLAFAAAAVTAVTVPVYMVNSIPLPDNTHLRDTGQRVPDAGYKWNGTPDWGIQVQSTRRFDIGYPTIDKFVSSLVDKFEHRNHSVFWDKGFKHPEAEFVYASDTEKKWEIPRGMRLKDAATLTVEWDPGQRHPAMPQIKAGKEDGTWEADFPYHFTRNGKKTDKLELSKKEYTDADRINALHEVLDRKLSTQWVGGLAHPKFENVFSDDKEGTYKTSPGYAWVTAQDGNRTDLRAKWHPGLVHSEHAVLAAGPKEGEWIAAFGYKVVLQADGKSVMPQWTPEMPSPDHRQVVSGKEPGELSPADGYKWFNKDDPASAHFAVVWNPYSASRLHEKIEAGEKEGTWVAKYGYKFVSPGTSLKVARDYSIILEPRDATPAQASVTASTPSDGASEACAKGAKGALVDSFVAHTFMGAVAIFTLGPKGLYWTFRSYSSTAARTAAAGCAAGVIANSLSPR